METLELNENLTPIFKKHLLEDPIENAFAIWDLIHERESSKFFLALRNGEVIGYLLIYFGTTHPSIILKGEKKAIEDLCKYINVNRGIFLVSPQVSSVIEKYFPITGKYVENYMLLRKGEGNIVVRHEVRRLTEKDVKDLTELLKEFWKTDEARCLRYIKSQVVYGAFIRDELVSTAGTHIRLPEIWIIGGVFTTPRHRNKGLATSVTSAVVKDALEKTDVVGLFVREDNIPAKRVYRKIGFREYSKVVWLDMKTGEIP